MAIEYLNLFSVKKETQFQNTPKQANILSEIYMQK